MRLGGRNSSRKLTVNIHETTCSTSFCINKNVRLLWIRLNMRQEAFPKPIGTHARKNHLFDNESKNGSAAKHIYQTFLGTNVATSEPGFLFCRQHLKCSTYGWFFALAFSFVYFLSPWAIFSLSLLVLDFSTFFSEYKIGLLEIPRNYSIWLRRIFKREQKFSRTKRFSH